LAINIRQRSCGVLKKREQLDPRRFSKLEGQVALVTGASAGLGAAIAIRPRRSRR